jgi:hypothetical protein
MSGVEIALLLAFAQLTALGVVSQLTGTGGSDQWARQLGVYLVVNVLPYFLPFVVALLLHRELRSEVFGRLARAPACGVPGYVRKSGA